MKSDRRHSFLEFGAKSGKNQQKFDEANEKNDDMDGQDLSIDRERASMKREHAMALAREHYELLHDGNGMKNEHIWRESQRVAIWDLHIQHLCGERNVGDMQMDGTILYTEPPYTVDDERIIRPVSYTHLTLPTN